MFYRVLQISILLAAGCSSQPLQQTDAGLPDLNMKIDCAQLQVCIGNCGRDPNCLAACATSASTAANLLSAAIVSCGYGVCEQLSDGGLQRCQSPEDSSATCAACLLVTRTGPGTGIPCSAPSDPMCGACASAVQSCNDQK